MINQEYYLKDDKCYVPQRDCCINEAGDDSTDIKIIDTPRKCDSVSIYQGENLVSHITSKSISINKDDESNAVVMEVKPVSVLLRGSDSIEVEFDRNTEERTVSIKEEFLEAFGSKFLEKDFASEEKTATYTHGSDISGPTAAFSIKENGTVTDADDQVIGQKIIIKANNINPITKKVENVEKEIFSVSPSYFEYIKNTFTGAGALYVVDTDSGIRSLFQALVAQNKADSNVKIIVKQDGTHNKDTTLWTLANNPTTSVLEPSYVTTLEYDNLNPVGVVDESGFGIENGATDEEANTQELKLTDKTISTLRKADNLPYATSVIEELGLEEGNGYKNSLTIKVTDVNQEEVSSATVDLNNLVIDEGTWDD